MRGEAAPKICGYILGLMSYYWLIVERMCVVLGHFRLFTVVLGLFSCVLAAVQSECARCSSHQLLVRGGEFRTGVCSSARNTCRFPKCVHYNNIIAVSTCVRTSL